MKRKSAIFMTVSALICINNAIAGITVIDFESLSELNVVHNQFASLGANFNDSELIYTQGSLLSANYPPHSGVNLAAYNHRIGTGIIRVWLQRRKVI